VRACHPGGWFIVEAAGISEDQLLQPATAPAEQEIENDNQQNQADTASAVIADTRTHVVPAAAK
jgi:hypothetical protein